MTLPSCIVEIILEYSMSYYIWSVKNELTELIFSMNRTSQAIDWLLFGFQLSESDSPNYALVCLEYCLELCYKETKPNGFAFSRVYSNVLLFEAHPCPDFLKPWHESRIYQCKALLSDVTSPLNRIFNKVFLIIKLREFPEPQRSRIKWLLFDIFDADVSEFIRCRVFSPFINHELTSRLFI